MLIKVEIAGTAAGSFMFAGGGVNLARNASLGNQLLNAGKKSKDLVKLYTVNKPKNMLHIYNVKKIDQKLTKQIFDVNFENSTANIAKGSTLLRNLTEQLAVKKVISNPLAGKNVKLRLRDPRWHESEGWVKMHQKVVVNNGKINVHYNFNEQTGKVADVKIKLPIKPLKLFKERKVWKNKK